MNTTTDDSIKTETKPETKPKVKFHRTHGDIVNEIPETARKVNHLRDIQLDEEYYVLQNQVYKKLKTGMFRSLVLQKSKTYEHYFMRDTKFKKLTVNAHKLEQLNYRDIEILNKEKDEQSSTTTGTEITKTEIDETGKSELE
jgi:hypothetical protein